jgi:hypothetical protein
MRDFFVPNIMAHMALLKEKRVILSLFEYQRENKELF